MLTYSKNCLINVSRIFARIEESIVNTEQNHGNYESILSTLKSVVQKLMKNDARY